MSRNEYLEFFANSVSVPLFFSSIKTHEEFERNRVSVSEEDMSSGCYTCPVAVIHAQWPLYMPSGCYTCPVAVIHAQWLSYMPSDCYTCRVACTTVTGWHFIKP